MSHISAANASNLISYTWNNRTFSLLPAPPPTFFSHVAANSTRLLLPLASLLAANGTDATGYGYDTAGDLAGYGGPPPDEVEGLRRWLWETVNLRIQKWELYFLRSVPSKGSSAASFG